MKRKQTLLEALVELRWLLRLRGGKRARCRLSMLATILRKSTPSAWERMNFGESISPQALILLPLREKVARSAGW